MKAEYIKTRRQGHSLIVAIDNPPVNALHPDVSDQILDAARAAEADQTVRSFILTGTGRCFVAGGDIKFFTTLDQQGAAKMALQVQEMQETLFNLRVPVIAALNGHAVGGGMEIAMAADLRLARRGGGKMGLPEVSLGLLPGTGGTQRLARLIGQCHGVTARRRKTRDRLANALAAAGYDHDWLHPGSPFSV